MTFTLYSSTSETSQTNDVAVFDINDDGYPDWIVGNTDTPGSLTHDIYVNNGDSTFTRSTFGNSAYFQKFSAGDIDGDGDIDLVSVRTGGIGLDKVQLYKNNGSNSFVLTTLTPSGTSSDFTSVELGDMDNDGDLDIIVGTGTPNTKALWKNDGHGNFAEVASTLPVANDVALADFNSDGYLDIAFTQQIAGKLRVYINSGTGAFIESSNYTENAASKLGAGDLNADGRIDIVTYNFTNNFVMPYIQQTNGTFVSSPGLSAAAGVQMGVLGDINNDGSLDILAATNAGSYHWFNDGNASFGSPTVTSAGDIGISVGMADFDADGDLDFVSGTTTALPKRFFKSDQAATSANTAPSAPTALTGAILGKSPQNGQTFANDPAIGTTSWANTGNAATSNDSYATTIPGPGGQSQYLKVTGFGYSIPSDATVLGIKVDVEKKMDAACIATDNAVRIVKGGAIGATDRSDGALWPVNDAYTSYGGPADLWGETWTASDINASNFGFAFSGKCGITGGQLSIDHIRMTVYYSAADVRLSWGSGSDTQTATKMLQYQLRVGTGSNAGNIVSGKTASPNWVTRVMPNGQSRTYLLKNLPCRTGLTYYWSVAAVDTGFKKASGTEQTFTLDNNCSIVFPRESSPPAIGGGLPARYFRTNLSRVTDASPGTGIITVTGFNDVDGNGSRSARETAGFKGLAITASGRTAESVVVRRTESLGDNGTAAFDLPVSDSRGYWILVDTGSSVLQDFSPTGATASGGYVLRSGDTTYVNVGFRRADLLAYKPCMLIGSATADEHLGTDAQILQQRLEDSFGMKIVRGLDLTGELVTRKEFFTLLSRSHCIETIRDAVTLEEKLRVSAKKMRIALPFIDLRNDVKNADSLLMYSLLAAGTNVYRSTLRGEAADLSSPVTREEAIRAVASILPLPAKPTVGVLPKDLDAADPLVDDFLALQQLGVLPESFQPILGQSQGLTPEESALMLMRAALRGGRVSLLPDTPNIKGLKTAAPTPTFLAVLPVLKNRSCLEKDISRASSVSFADVLPGDPLFADLQDLLMRGTKNSAKQMLWLIPATRRPTEFGISRGQTRASLDEPASLLETVRNLLVFGCLAPETALDVMSGKQKPVTQGSGEMRVARDRISGLPRDASFASRTLYRAQDHLKEFDLSLFTYAPELLRTELRSPGSSMSVTEASRMLASGLLMTYVRNKSLSPLQAENVMEELSAAIRRDLTGRDVDWRDESSLKTVPFTKQMLFSFLATIVKGKTVVSVSVPSLPLGEIWWQRIK